MRCQGFAGGIILWQPSRIQVPGLSLADGQHIRSLRRVQSHSSGGAGKPAPTFYLYTSRALRDGFVPSPAQLSDETSKSPRVAH